MEKMSFLLRTLMSYWMTSVSPSSLC